MLEIAAPAAPRGEYQALDPLSCRFSKVGIATLLDRSVAIGFGGWRPEPRGTVPPSRPIAEPTTCSSRPTA